MKSFSKFVSSLKRIALIKVSFLEFLIVLSLVLLIIGIFMPAYGKMRSL